jgi:predicted glycosyltransferase
MPYRPERSGTDGTLRIWIDLDNTPHPSFFRPIATELRARGHDVTVTARRGRQTVELGRLYGLDPLVVGGIRGRLWATKAATTVWRALRLALFGTGRHFDLAISHGSRPLVLAGWALRVPVLTIYDYEGVDVGLFRRFSDRLLVPEAVRAEMPDEERARVLGYPGTKEDVYLADFQPEPGIRDQLGVTDADLLVLLRPEADAAHYHPRDRQPLLEAMVDRLATDPRVHVALLPRGRAQRRDVGALLDDRGIRWSVPRPVDGRQLVWAADLVIGGGGTMTREAAVLGVPACSVFQGPTGAVDRSLEAGGRLQLLRGVEDALKVRLERRADSAVSARSVGREPLKAVVDTICAVARAPTDSTA